MTAYAIIHNGTVIDVLKHDPTGRTHAGMTVVTLPDGSPVTAGYTYANGLFTPPVLPTPTPRKSHEDLLAQFTDAEKTALIAKAQTDIHVFVFLSWVSTRGAIVANSKRLSDGFDLLTSEGVLAPGRKAEILAAL